MSKVSQDTSPHKGRFAYEGLDRVLHERARLGILTGLACRTPPLTFADLRDLCDLTDGNLSRHLHALEEAGIVELRKGTLRGRPQTLVVFTDGGQRRYLDYVDVLAKIVHDSDDVRRACAGGKERLRPMPEGWLPAR